MSQILAFVNINEKCISLIYLPRIPSFVNFNTKFIALIELPRILAFVWQLKFAALPSLSIFDDNCLINSRCLLLSFTTKRLLRPLVRTHYFLDPSACLDQQWRDPQKGPDKKIIGPYLKRNIRLLVIWRSFPKVKNTS